jgi:hypothetical protein
MYGMVNEAVRMLVTEKFGAEAWNSIRARAAAPEVFSPLQAYDDAVTYGLVGACVEVLKLPADAVLRTFGRYWVEKIAVVSYAELLSRTGTDFVSFVRNLDHMHARIRTTFPNYQPPSFRVLALDDGRLQIDYYSQREGLLPFVEGLFEGLADHFEIRISLAHVPAADNPMPSKRMILTFAAARG